MAEEAFAGDIIGLPNHGNLRIGDVLSEGEKLTITGIPSFAPEYMQKVLADDPMRAKHLNNALEQLAEEGVARIFKPLVETTWIVGVVGPLQFDVLADRIRTEYNIPVHFEGTSHYAARWVRGDSAKIKTFMEANRMAVANDHDGDVVFLARNAWHLGDVQDKNKDLQFCETK